VRQLSLGPMRSFRRTPSQDPHLEVDRAGFTAHAVGVGAYVLGADDEDDEPAQLVSVIAFERGYYD
jgi:hypothetical protein